MDSTISPREVVIHEGNFHHFVHDPVIDGERKARGLIPRNYATHPVGYYATIPAFHAVDMPVLSTDEIKSRLKDRVAEQALLSNVRMTCGPGGGMMPSLDQNGRGYCWMHSGTGATMILRGVMNEPYVGLSAYACACLIKNYRDEGGWGAQGVDYITEKGVPAEQFWPMRAVDRKYDKPETWANAALHKVTAGWVDLQAAQYDRKLSFDQVCTCLVSGIPVVGDFNWWGHSVCLLDVVDGASEFGIMRAESGKLLTQAEFDAIWSMDDPVAAGLGVRILNSWGDSWSDHGMGLLAGSKAIPDGAVAPRVTIPSVV